MNDEDYEAMRADEAMLCEFQERVEQIPHDTRKKLETMYLMEHLPYDDGGEDYSLDDYLWHVFDFQTHYGEAGLISYVDVMEFSLSFVLACRSALGLKA